MQYSADIQSILLKNIVVVGGGTSIRGLKERIIRDLIREIPINSEIKVKIGKGGSIGAFLGMQNICHQHR